MDLKGNGVEVRVNATEQSDEWLESAAQEIVEAAKERGLELPAFAGTVAVEAAAQEAKVDPTDLKEAITGQLTTAFMGYQVVGGQINEGLPKKRRFELATAEKLSEEFAAWFTDEKAEQATRLMESDPELGFSLVATPNVVVAPSEAITLAEEFGKNQPYKTYMYEPIVKSYTPEQLSGTNPENGNSVQFSLIPNKLNPDLYGTVAQQRAALAKLQTEMPDLRVPSFLEDLTYWQTLRSQGDNLAHGDVFERTYIRHFDLPDQRFGGYACVLLSCVDDFGEPRVRGSDARFDGRGRALVG